MTTITITVKETDVAPETATVQITITVSPSGGGASPLEVDASGVPTSATVGQAYSGKLNVSGGVPPYTFQVNGALPPGISLMSDGSFSGTPTEAGSFSFAVDVSDSES